MKIDKSIQLTARLSNKWFKATELSIATASGCSGMYLGTGLGYIIPPLVMTGPSRENLIYNFDNDFDNTTITTTIISAEWTEKAYQEVEKQILWTHVGTFQFVYCNNYLN